MKIIDDFMIPEMFDHIQSVLMGPDFPYYVQKSTSYANDGNYQLTHLFKNDDGRESAANELFYSTYDKLGVKELLRSKINFLHGTEEVNVHGMHTDFGTSVEPYTTSILYLNTCNGYTLFQDGTKVESVANRLVTFDGYTRHTGTTCSDEQYRLVLNVNYRT